MNVHSRGIIYLGFQRLEWVYGMEFRTGRKLLVELVIREYSPCYPAKDRSSPGVCNFLGGAGRTHLLLALVD